MRLQKFLGIFFLMLLPTPVMSFMNCFHFSVGGEALYWKPCIEPYQYGEISTVSVVAVINEQLTLTPDYKWGWRVFANLADNRNCVFLDGEWAHVEGTTKKTNRANGGTLNVYLFENGLIAPANSVEALNRTQYDKAGGKAGLRLWGNKCLYFYGYLGGRWIRIDVKQESIVNAVTTGSSREIVSRTVYRGGAFEAGIGGQADILCGLGASFRLGALAPIVKREHTFSLTQSTGTLLLENSFSDCLCKGGFEMRGAINYMLMRQCVWLKVEAGYELDTYFQALLREQPALNSVNIISDHFAIGGPFVGITVGF